MWTAHAAVIGGADGSRDSPVSQHLFQCISGISEFETEFWYESWNSKCNFMFLFHLSVHWRSKVLDVSTVIKFSLNKMISQKVIVLFQVWDQCTWSTSEPALTVQALTLCLRVDAPINSQWSMWWIVYLIFTRFNFLNINHKTRT